MKDEYDDNDFPLAYLITIRTFGTWLHGDEKFSVDRKYNIFGTPKVDQNNRLNRSMKDEMRQEPTIFDYAQQDAVKEAIIEVCEYRGYELHAVNVLSNHVHVVVSANVKPTRIVDAFKSYATRNLREKFLISRELKVWARGRSRRYLWKPRQVSLAVEYVLYGQGDIIAELFELPEWDD